MSTFDEVYDKIQDFLALAQSLNPIYLKKCISHNTMTLVPAAVLTLLIEVIMVVRLFINHPAMDTPASRVYFGFYLAQIGISCLFLLIYKGFQNSGTQEYWMQMVFVGSYLLWNVLLNSYDLYRNGRGSSLALVTAIIFVAVLVQFRPWHMMMLQLLMFALFFAINHGRIEDTINTCIAVSTGILANLLFYVRDIQAVDAQQQMEQMHAHLEKEQLDGAKQYLRRLQEIQTKTNIYHHDLRHSLYFMEQLVKQGNLEKLQAFISQNQESLQELVPLQFCQHDTVNLLLGSFYQRATEKNITFQVQARLPQSLAVEDTALCALLSNLLENALHGAEKVAQPEQRRIHIAVFVRDNKLVVQVENTFSGMVVIKNNRPVFQGQDKHHGFGILSIINITERYNGLYAFETHDQVFRARVLLHL